MLTIRNSNIVDIKFTANLENYSNDQFLAI